MWRVQLPYAALLTPHPLAAELALSVSLTPSFLSVGSCSRCLLAVVFLVSLFSTCFTFVCYVGRPILFLYWSAFLHFYRCSDCIPLKVSMNFKGCCTPVLLSGYRSCTGLFYITVGKNKGKCELIRNVFQLNFSLVSNEIRCSVRGYR